MRAGVGTVDLPYVKPERDRQGRVTYWYFRRSGRRWRLPGAPLSAEWMAEYDRLKASTAPQKPDASAKPVAGSVKALVAAYQASPEWRNLKPSSQSLYQSAIAPLIERVAHLPVALIERKHVQKWRDERANTPGMANMLVKVLSLLLSYAIESGLRRDNPARGLKAFKLGEHRAWTADELAAYERRWAPGTMQRRAYALARYTGQRCGDVAAMTSNAREGGAIRVRQQKTGKLLWVPEHRDLAAELARGEQSHVSLLTRACGSGFDGRGLGGWFAGAIAIAGLPAGCVMHGLRKVAARDMAEAGCTEHEIASVTGQSLAEVERYTRAASQERLAEAAILKLERNENRSRGGKPSRRASGKQRLSD